MSPRTERRWLLPALIVLVLMCIFFIGGKLGSQQNSQVEQTNSIENEILVIPVQIERESYGIAMVDTVGQTLWIYEINSRGPAHNRLRLLAARSWQYDRLLQDLNTAEPKPEKVKMMLEDLGLLQMKKQQDIDISILEIAEPNIKDSKD